MKKIFFLLIFLLLENFNSYGYTMGHAAIQFEALLQEAVEQYKILDDLYTQNYTITKEIDDKYAQLETKINQLQKKAYGY